MNALELDSDHIRVIEHGALLRATLARSQKLNALTRTMYVDLCRVVDHVATRDDLNALLIDGDGRAFCAGNDIHDFANTDPHDYRNGEVPVSIQYVLRLAALDKPVIIAVQGNATGIGTTMLLHADLVIAADSAHFCTAFVDLALVPEAGSSLLLPALVGRQNAARLLLAGDTIDADEALRMGLVAYRCADDELTARALELGGALAAKPPVAMRQSKQLMRRDPERIGARIDKETERFAERLVSDEAKAIFAKFLNR